MLVAPFKSAPTKPSIRLRAADERKRLDNDLTTLRLSYPKIDLLRTSAHLAPEQFWRLSGHSHLHRRLIEAPFAYKQ